MSFASHRRPRLSDPSTFNVHLDLQTAHVTAIGRLDGRSAALLHEAVSVLLGTEQPTLTVDVSGMDVADHAALRAIGDAYRRALRQGRRITLRGASPQLRSALTQLHLGHHLLFDDAPPTTTNETLTMHGPSARFGDPASTTSSVRSSTTGAPVAVDDAAPGSGAPPGTASGVR